jgi:hypothetical protein
MLVKKCPASLMSKEHVCMSSVSSRACGSQWQMSHNHKISATYYDLIGKTKLLVETKKYRECSMIYGPNFRNRNGSFVINSVKISEMALDAIYL